jgi:hypothetical protein
MPDKEFTLMFYLAADNLLTPSVVTQLKAIKQAGFHPDVNVVAYFDPQSEDTPNHIFDVNLINKLGRRRNSDTGFPGDDPYVRTLMEDKLWMNQKNRDDTDTIRLLLQRSLAAKGVSYDPPVPPPDRVVNGSEASSAPESKDIDRMAEPTSKEPPIPKEMGPQESLASFLKFCSENYSAKRYMLFILGHGMVVGNDIFLYDEHVDSNQQSLSLVGLGQVLKAFARDVRGQGAEFELISFHSCSVSSLEVAHELQYDKKGKFRGTANYMLASQGPAFVGSWPYREIVIRVLNDVRELKEKGTEIDVKHMLVRIFRYVLHNSSDFLLAGYSFQLTLCDLNKVSESTSPLKKLSDGLLNGLTDPIVRNLILLAHWKSISFWQENYTDLYDFCFCLCEEYRVSGWKNELMDTIQTACAEVINQLTAGQAGDNDRLIVRTDFAGPAYQYSHGLSVFFPWAEPSGHFMFAYNGYRFTATSWQEFLEKYFKETKRRTRKDEEGLSPESREVGTGEESSAAAAAADAAKLKEDIASICYNNEGPLNIYNTAGDRLDKPLNKTDVRDPMGNGCSCGSIKNYPRDTRRQGKRAGKAAKPAMPLGPKAFNLFG